MTNNTVTYSVDSKVDSAEALVLVETSGKIHALDVGVNVFVFTVMCVCVRGLIVIPFGTSCAAYIHGNGWVRVWVWCVWCDDDFACRCACVSVSVVSRCKHPSLCFVLVCIM